MLTIAVVDGQGGGIGSHIMRRLREALPVDVELVALGTNAVATQAMMKAKANRGASGQEAIRVTAARVDVIVGAMAVCIPHAMMGEVTPEIASALSLSPAPKFLLPLRAENITLTGHTSTPFPHLIDNLVDELKDRYFPSAGGRSDV